MPILRALARGRSPLEAAAVFPEADSEEAEILEMVLDSVRRFRDDRLDGGKHDRDEALPPEVREGLAELGLFGLIFPEAHGGMGLGMRAYTRVFETISWECQAVPTLLGGHLSLAGRGLMLFGTEEQKARWLPRMSRGECIGAFALTEAEAGSDFRSLRTVARRTEGGWLVNGSKLWITNGSESGLLLTFARQEGAEGGLGAFLVDRSREGVSIGRPEEKMGLHASSTTPVEFDGAFVPDEDLLGAPGQGFEIAVEILNRGRAGWAGACLGVSRRALEEALQHAAQREQYGRPILRFGMMREYLAAMTAEVEALDAVMELVAGLSDQGEGDLVMEAAALKIYATEVNDRVTDLALQIAGGNGFSREYPYERMVRDARVSRIFEGTNEVLRMLVARQFAAAATSAQAPTAAATAAPPAGLAPELQPAWQRLLADARDLAGECTRLVAGLGADFRFAESHHRRIADRAVSLVVRFAVLLRAATEPDRTAPAVLLYALRLLEREAQRAAAEAADPDDALAEAAAAVLEARTAPAPR